MGNLKIINHKLVELKYPQLDELNPQPEEWNEE